MDLEHTLGSEEMSCMCCHSCNVRVADTLRLSGGVEVQILVMIHAAKRSARTDSSSHAEMAVAVVAAEFVTFVAGSCMSLDTKDQQATNSYLKELVKTNFT